MIKKKNGKKNTERASTATQTDDGHATQQDDATKKDRVVLVGKIRWGEGGTEGTTVTQDDAARCRMERWREGGRDGRTDGRRETRTDGRTDGRTERRADGGTNERRAGRSSTRSMNIYLCIYAFSA